MKLTQCRVGKAKRAHRCVTRVGTARSFGKISGARLCPPYALAVVLALAGGATASSAQEPLRPEPGTAARHAPAYGRWGFDDSGVDPTARPGDSFFDFANGRWNARTAIPADKSRFGMFDALTDKTQEQVRAIIEEAAKSNGAPDTDAGKIGGLYVAFMDEARIERLDAAPHP